MTGALSAFAIVVLIPLFVATWRTSLLGLSLQGVLIACPSCAFTAFYSHVIVVGDPEKAGP